MLTYDHRGTGRSTAAPAENISPASISVASMACDVVALMDALQVGGAAFVGHALGGAIGMEVAIRTGRIKGLVVVNGWRHLSAHTRRCFSARMDLLRGSGARAFVEAQPLFLFPPDWIADHDAQLNAQTDHHLAAFPGVSMMEQRLAAVQVYEPDPQGLAGLRNALVIATRDDFLVPYATALDLADGLPDAQVATFDWGGHACNVTDAERFNALVCDFLRS